jgi:hypothetical protein
VSPVPAATTIRRALRRIRREQSARFLRAILISETRTKAAALLDQVLVDELIAAGLPRLADAIVRLSDEVDAASDALRREQQ